MIPQREYFDKSIANSDNTDGYYIIEQGDFVYNPRKSSDAPYGPVSIYKYPESGIVSPLYLCFRALKPINSSFYDYFFKSPSWHRYIYLSGDSGARHDRVSIKDDVFFSMPVYIPSEEEQLKVSSFLSLMEKRIADQQQLVERLKKYKRGLLSAVFSRELSFSEGQWISKPFAEIAHLGKKRYTPSPNESKPCIELEHIEQLTGRLLGSVNSSEQNSQKSAFEKGDVLFGKLRPYLKKYALPDFEGVCSTEIWVFKPTECITSEFLYYLVQSEEFINAANISSGTKMPRAEWSKVASTVFFLPNIEDQTKIVNLLMKIDKKINTESMLLEKLEQFKKATLQKLFV